MTNSSKNKGDRAELEVQALFRDHIGTGRRALGAGRKDDIGDITGLPQLCVQVVNWKDVAAAVRHKPVECEQQRVNLWRQHYEAIDDVYAATFVRLRGGEYRVVMTPEQFFAMYREAILTPLARPTRAAVETSAAA